MMKTEQLSYFLVGAPRSGTTLLTAMLNAHSKIAAGPETHFFSKISIREYQKMIEDPLWPLQAVDKFDSLTLAGQRVLDLFNISKKEFYEKLIHADKSVQGIINTFYSIYLERRKKEIWLEKTPNHILHLDLIRKEFPEAKIIRIVRDPRDVCESMLKLKWTYNHISNAYIWNYWFNKSKYFFESDPNVYTIKYEDLITNLEAELRKICNFLSIDFELEMLDPGNGAKDITSKQELWKNQVSGKVDIGRVYPWKKNMAKNMADCISLICNEGIRYFNYEQPGESDSELLISNYSAWNVAHSAKAILNLSKQNIRLVLASDDNYIKRVELFPVRAKRQYYKPLNFVKSVKNIIKNKAKSKVTIFYNHVIW